MILGIPFLPIGLFVYGWTVQYKVHWIVPIIFTGFTGAGLILSFVSSRPSYFISILANEMAASDTDIHD